MISQNQHREVFTAMNGETDFDIMMWVRCILGRWYFFVFGLLIALAIALAENRKWIPAYYTIGTMIIKESSAYGNNNVAMMNGFGADAGSKNLYNQKIILGSYDLISRVIDSLPFFRVEYITQGRFRTRNIYTNTPIIIEPLHVNEKYYNTLFEAYFVTSDSIDISLPENVDEQHFQVGVNQQLTCPWFDINIHPNASQYWQKGSRLYFSFKRKEDLTNEFLNRLKLGFIGDRSTILSIALISSTPKRDIDFINKLCSIALLHNLEQKNKVAENTINFIDRQLQVLQFALDTSENKMTTFRQNNNFINVNNYGNQLISSFDAHNKEIMEIDLRQTYINYLLDYINHNINNNAIIMPSTFGINENYLLNLVQQYNSLFIKQNEITDKNPYYHKYAKDLEVTKEAIHEYIRSMQNSLNIQKTEIEVRMHKIEQDIKNLPSKELQMIALERSYRIDDNYYTFFLQKRAEAEILRASNMPDNAILDKARTTHITNAKEKNKNLYLAFMAGLFFPLALIILLELLNTKIRTEQELKQLYPKPVLGVLQHLKTLSAYYVHAKPRSTYVENLRSIQYKIEFVAKRKENIMIVVTSAESGDGKTLFSTHLASLYALTNKKTVLVDLDIRKPGICSQLNIENGKGATNYFIQESTLDNIQVHLSDTLDVIPAGIIPPNPAELLKCDQFHNLIQQLKQQYKFIIVDTSPIGIVSDATELMQIADVNILIVRAHKTNKYGFKQTLEYIHNLNNIDEKTHTVLTDLPLKNIKRYGRYGYGKYATNYYSED